MSEVFDRVLMPIASRDDAETSSRAIRTYEPDSVVAVYVVEKAGGAPDKASVEQAEEEAEAMFDIVETELADSTDVETLIVYGVDVADRIHQAADDVDASSIAFTTRGGSRWVRMLTGDVALNLITDNEHPVVVLPDVSDE
jgi:nucleotide-binding universal stress UspA family protein